MSSTKKANANITKVKKIFSNKSENERKAIIENILDKYDFITINVDNEIIENYKDKLLKNANEVIFYQRLDELLSEITNRILNSINNLTSYILTRRRTI